MKPKFQFGQEVKIIDDFFGSLEGTVLNMMVEKKGIWPFKKKTTYYTVETYLPSEELSVGIVIEEKYLRPIENLKIIK